MTTAKDLDSKFLRTLPGNTPGDVAADKLKYHQRQRASTWRSWDRLTHSEEFEAYLHSQNLHLATTERHVEANWEIEQAALGAMLMLDDQAVTEGMLKLNASHFDKTIHRLIFGAICAVAQRRSADLSIKHIDTILVSEQLQKWGQGDDITSLYLFALIESCPSSANIDAYIKRVIANSRLRHLNLLSREVTQLTREPDADGTRIAAFSRLATHRILRDGWCDIEKLFKQVTK